MKRLAGLVLPLAVAAPFGAAPIGAAAADLTTAQMNLIVQVARRSPANPTAEDVLAALTRAIRIYDVAKDGLDAEDLKQVERVRQALARSLRMPSFLQADLDNDRRVTRAEYDFVRRAAPNMRWPTTAGDPFGETDADGDDIVTWEELSRDAKAASIAPGGELAAAMLDFDPTQDGKFTLDDAKTVADRVMAALDKDSDGLISLEESRPIPPNLAALRAAGLQIPTRVAPPQTEEEVCAFPKASADQDVIRIGAYQGVVRSSAHAGDSGHDTYVATVTVEPGEKKLYVVAAAYEGMIWRFEGAVERLSQVVTGGYYPQGVIGVPRDKVFVAPARNCIEIGYQFDTARGLIAKHETSRRVGRPVAAAGGTYSLEAITIPSMAVAPERRRVRGEAEPVAEIDPGTVVSASPAGAFDVLPGDAGLAQLLKNGSLVQIKRRQYRVVKPFPTFPTGLTGGDRATFIIAKGVPTPQGDIGHSCIIMEETGELVRGLRPMCEN